MFLEKDDNLIPSDFRRSAFFGRGFCKRGEFEGRLQSQHLGSG